MARIRVVTDSAHHAKLIERRLAAASAGPLNSTGIGIAGVEAVRWVDIAQLVLAVESPEPLREVRRRDVATLGVRVALAELDASAPEWLRLSREHPASWHRLARSIGRASHLIESPDAELPLSNVPIAARVEGLLRADGGVLPGRLLVLAADALTRMAPRAAERILGRLIAPMEQAGEVPAVRALRAALDAAGVLISVPTESDADDRLDERHDDAGDRDRRAVIVPDAQSEARVVASAVAGWLAAGVSYEDISVVVPDGSAYTSVVSEAMDAYGIPVWAPAGRQLLAGTPAGAVAMALARALDPLPGCRGCAGDGVHRCDGLFAPVSMVISAVTPSTYARTVLGAARELNLTSGLGNWGTLLRWLAGDDDELPGVTRRNAHATMERERVRRAPQGDVELQDFQEVCRLLAQALSSGDERPRERLIAGLEILDQAARRSDRGALTAMSSVQQALTDSPADGSTATSVARSVVEGAWGETARPGDGVALLPVSDLTAVEASHVAWCGLAEGLCPPPATYDALVVGDREQARALHNLMDDQARRIEAQAENMVVTAPRVRIGTRSVEVASRWLVQWLGLHDVGAASLLSSSSAAAQLWRDRSRWPIDVEDTSLDVMARYPLPAESRPETAEASAAAADALLARIQAWAGPTPTVFDGVLGPLADGTSWIDGRVARGSVLSPSRAMEFAACPRKFFFSTVVGLRSDDDDPALGRDIPPNRWGDIVHGALAIAFSAMREHPDERIGILAGAIQEQVSAHLPFLALSAADLLELADSQSRIVVRVIPEDAWQRELPDFEDVVVGTIEGLDFSGYIDVAWPDLVVDLKTGKRDDVKYLPQVGVYAELMSQRTGTPVESAIWFVKDGSSSDLEPAAVTGPTSTGGSSEETSPQTAVAHTLKNGVDLGLFPAIGDPSKDRSDPCGFCDFTVICDPNTGIRWEQLQESPVFQPVLVDVREGA